MTNALSDFVRALQTARLADLAITAGLVLIAVCLHLLHGRFREKGAAGALALCKWLAAFAALRFFDTTVLKGVWETAAFVFYGVFLWLAFRVVLHDIYADLYMTRLKRGQVSKILLNLLSFAASLALVGYGLRYALNVDVGSLLTSSAILTAVIGFSMQDTIGSLFSGLLIQTEKPFKIGDWIKVGDIEGQVTEITWRYTKLVTIAQNQLLYTNNSIVKERVTNLSEPIRQVRQEINVPAPLHTPPVKVKSALEEVLRKSRLVAPAPEPNVRLHEIDLHQALYRLTFFVDDYLNLIPARNEVLSAAWYEFRNQGIEFPMARQAWVSGRSLHHEPPEDILELMRGIDLFQGMHPDEMDLIVQCAAIRTYSAGTRIVERGQNGTTMFILTSGSVAVRVGETELARLGPGDVFGEMALLTGEPRVADVVALEPSSCLEVDREAFRGVLDKNPAIVANVTRVFQEREKLRATSGQAGQDAEEGLLERFRRIFW